MASSSSSQTEIVLAPSDIPGAELTEPLEQHRILELKWWLQCRGINVSGSMKKAAIINRIHELISEGKANDVIDVDGSYLYKKVTALNDVGASVAPLPPPKPPLIGWDSLTSENCGAMSNNLPPVTQGLVYTYLASHVGRSGRTEGAFRALRRGYIHWASGRVDKIEVNYRNPKYCHVRSTITPSMKSGKYKVYLLLGRDQGTAVLEANCECAAGKSASCTHVSALLHALVAVTPSGLTSTDSQDDSDDDSTPVTSQLCKWTVPRKRKESKLTIMESTFKKHDYSKPVKKQVRLLDDFDPRPVKFRGTASERLPSLLDSIRGQQLSISLLLDPECACTCTKAATTTEHNLPSTSELKKTISSFKESLKLSEDKIREVEQNTREQRLSSLWFSSRRYRLTASQFGRIFSRKSTTPPDKLVLELIQRKSFVTSATRYGVETEATAIQEYVNYQHKHGHSDLAMSSSGFHISPTHPFLGASPDGSVYDSQDIEHPFGFLEVKCPYVSRDLTPVDCCQNSVFCCTLEPGTSILKLKRNHSYFAQIQGQMAIGGRPWCDFVIYTNKGINVQRINFDEKYWTDELLPKLEAFYNDCFAPELVSPVHALGLPIRHLSKTD